MIIHWVPRIYGYSAEFKWGRAVAVLKLERKKPGELEVAGEEPGNWQGSLTFDGDHESAFVWSSEIYSDDDVVREEAIGSVQWALHGMISRDIDLEQPVPKDIKPMELP